MPRHALSRIAGAVFAVLVITAGVMAVAYGDARLLVLLVYRQFAEGAGELAEFDADLFVMLVGMGLAQAWGLAQILPGRRGGGTTSKLALPVTTAPAPGGDQGGQSGDSGRSGETRQTRDQLLLRTALYVLMAIELTDQLPWPEDIPEAVAHIAVVVLFYRVMGTVSRTLRLVALLAGLCWPTLGLVEMALDLFGGTLHVLPPGANLAWVVSTILIVVAQAKDGRWGRTTLWAGAVMAAGPFLMPLIAYPDSRTYVIYAASRLLLDVFTVVWLGRSASEVGCRPRAPRPRSRGAFRLRPWAVVAVGLPLLPAVANWTNGAFLWIGPGISPLWHSAAFTGSALILLFLYGERPPRRKPYQLALASLAAVTLLVLVPVSDHAPRPATTRGECENDSEATGERAFVCAVRKLDAPPFPPSMPDQRLIAYGHRMCGVYTRGDALEAATFKQTYGVDPRAQKYLLEDICPKVAAEFDAAVAKEEAEIEAWEAEEQAMCDQAPRHRPKIKPVRAIREKKPVWTELSLEAFDEEADLDDDLVWRAKEGDLVVTAPGRLTILVNTELRMCVTTETYDRRPPVETKGWDHVVEAGYESRDGTLIFGDGLSGVALPDLASRGKALYRVRIHYAWLSKKGRQRAGQRLLIMAYPWRGDEVIVHRKP